MNNKTRYLTKSAMIAGIYVVLTFISAIFGISSGAIQVRLSEALTILPFFMPEAVLGLFAGCFISNLLTGCAIWDIVAGSLTTLLAAYLTNKIKNKYLMVLPPIILNALIIPFVLIYAYGIKDGYWYLTLTVGAGQVVSCGILGGLLFGILNKNKIFNSNR